MWAISHLVRMGCARQWRVWCRRTWLLWLSTAVCPGGRSKTWGSRTAWVMLTILLGDSPRKLTRSWVSLRGHRSWTRWKDSWEPYTHRARTIPNRRLWLLKDPALHLWLNPQSLWHSRWLYGRPSFWAAYSGIQTLSFLLIYFWLKRPKIRLNIALNFELKQGKSH